MRINTNMAALNAWRSMTSNNTNMSKSLEKLSSGYRINRAADDAAGLAVSEKMRAQIRGLNQAVRNSQDGVALVQTAEGGAGQIQGMLQRMRELTVQANNGALSDADRGQLNTEFQSLLSEIDRTSGSITYNNIKLLNGSTTTTTTAQTAMSSNTAVGTFTATGATAGDVKLVKVTALADNARVATTSNLVAATGTGVATDSGYMLKINGTTVYNAAAGQAVDKSQIAAAINSNAGLNATLQATYNSTTGELKIESKNTGAGQSFTIDEYYADGATGAATADSLFDAGASGQVTRTGVNSSYSVNGGAPVSSASNTISITSGGGTIGGTLTAVGSTTITVSTSTASANTGTLSLDLQIGANDGDELNIQIGALSATSLGINGLAVNNLTAIGSGSTGVLQKIDSALTTLSSFRANLGAYQNRLENISSTLQVSSENLTSAESRIRDVDMASEMAQFTKYQVLSQASTSMLAQANQGTQGILSLLR